MSSQPEEGGVITQNSVKLDAGRIAINRLTILDGTWKLVISIFDLAGKRKSWSCSTFPAASVERIICGARDTDFGGVVFFATLHFSRSVSREMRFPALPNPLRIEQVANDELVFRSEEDLVYFTARLVAVADVPASLISHQV